MPQELHGMRSEINGKNLCFAYNMRNGCSTSGKDRCERGHHMCCYPECQAPEDHSLQRCPEYAKRVLKNNFDYARAKSVSPLGRQFLTMSFRR